MFPASFPASWWPHAFYAMPASAAHGTQALCCTCSRSMQGSFVTHLIHVCCIYPRSCACSCGSRPAAQRCCPQAVWGTRRPATAAAGDGRALPADALEYGDGIPGRPEHARSSCSNSRPPPCFPASMEPSTGGHYPQHCINTLGSSLVGCLQLGTHALLCCAILHKAA